LISDESPAKAELDDNEWSNGNGETPDDSALTSLQLTHRAIAKFPDLSKRYKWFIGTAAVVAPALVTLASIAVTRRLHRGQSPETILAEITPDEIENAGKAKPAKPKRVGKSNGAQLH
jgi:hypothetical protein